MAKIYKTRKAAEKGKTKAKRDKPFSAWGVIRAPGGKGWLVGARRSYTPGWFLLGGGWLKEGGFK